jgi:hypothetical protein
MDIVLKLCLLIMQLLILLGGGHLRESIIEGTEVILKISLHITQPLHHGVMHSIIDMMTKGVQTSINLMLKILLHSLKSVSHLLSICLKVRLKPRLHFLKLRVH